MTSSSDETGANLGKLAEQLMDIAQQLRRDSEGLPFPNMHADRGVDRDVSRNLALNRPAENDRDLTRLAGASDLAERRLTFAIMATDIYQSRRRRAAIFGDTELFGEPAWDILLDLYVAHAERKPVSVSSACIGSASPPTTGLRWLGVLADRDLILREHDPEDQRRVLVRLTERGLRAMDDYFASQHVAA